MNRYMDCFKARLYMNKLFERLIKAYAIFRLLIGLDFRSLSFVKALRHDFKLLGLGTIHKWRHLRRGGRGVKNLLIWGDFQGVTEVTREGRGVKNFKNWGDIIYGRSLTQIQCLAYKLAIFQVYETKCCSDLARYKIFINAMAHLKQPSPFFHLTMQKSQGY